MTTVTPAPPSSTPPPTPTSAEIPTTKAGLLAEAAGNTNSLERARLIARHLEESLAAERASASRLTQRLSTLSELKARLETQVQTMRNQTWPSLLLQAASAAAGSIGGYLLGVQNCRPYGWAFLAIAFCMFIAAGWFQLAHPTIKSSDGSASTGTS